MELVDELHPEPPLLPTDPLRRARARSLALLFAADHHPLIRGKNYCKAMRAVRLRWLRLIVCHKGAQPFRLVME
jgi:glutathione S-transferase